MNEEWNANCKGKSQCQFNPSQYLTEEAFGWREEEEEELIDPAIEWYYYYDVDADYFDEVEVVEDEEVEEEIEEDP